MLSIVRVNEFELGLRFQRGKLVEVLSPGWHVAVGWRGERIDVVSETAWLLDHPERDQIVRSGLMAAYLEVVDLTDDERALLFIDRRFAMVLPPGRHAVFKRWREVAIERFIVAEPRFTHRLLFKIAQAPGSELAITSLVVEPHQTCLYYRDGRLIDELEPGFYAFWKNCGKLQFVPVDRREHVIDLAGQEIITADKVTLRLNAVIGYRIVDARKAVAVAASVEPVLYREAQLLLRAAIGARRLDEALAAKEALVDEINRGLAGKAEKLGLEIVSCGIKDLILPGDIRELMNRVVAAQKEAEANQIVRREETAATRSQCNTAKMLEQNPLLMRLRELEVLERVATKSKLRLVLGEKGLTDRLANLL